MLRSPVPHLAVVVVLLTAPLFAGEDDPLSRASAAAAEGHYAAAIDTLRDALDASPDDARILLALGEMSERHARQAIAEAGATVGRLGFVDALGWYEKARTAAPDSREALAGVGRMALEMGEFPKAEAAWAEAARRDPEDGEPCYQLGYAFFLEGRLDEAIGAFDAAEKLLGNDARIRLNRGICAAKKGDTEAARADLLPLVRAEVGAGRPSSPAMRSALLWLWKAHAERREFAAAEEIYARLASEYPALSAGPWYLGHARLAAGDAAGAAEAFRRVTALLPTWPDGWRKCGGALVAAGSFDDAVGALKAELSLDPGGEAPRSLLLEIADGLRGADRIPDAIDLLERMESAFEDDPVLLERRGDLRFESGDAEGALADYEATVDIAASAREAEVKAEKCATILLRGGTAPEEYLKERLAAEPASPGPGGVIFDFEDPGVFPRLNGKATWRREGGALRLTRTGEPGEAANLSLTFIPTLDFRPFASLRFRIRGPKGTHLRLRAKDCRDPLEMSPGSGGRPLGGLVGLTGDWQTVTLPAGQFHVDGDNRPRPLVTSRMRAIIFEIGAGDAPRLPFADEIVLDDVVLVRPDGSTLPLADFDDPPREEIFLTAGGTMPASPPPPGDGIRPDPSTFVNPVILGRDYDPSTVHSGTGSYRIRLVEEGLAEVALSLVPGRDLTEAAAITFWARGEKGGERVRVGLEDSLDEDIGNAWPASSPRGLARYRLLEGWYELTPEWRRYVIPCAEQPDIDFRQLVRIRFIMGTDLGNAVGTTMYVDDIGWE